MTDIREQAARAERKYMRQFCENCLGYYTKNQGDAYDDMKEKYDAALASLRAAEE
jgi:hypothetical protein